MQRRRLREIAAASAVMGPLLRYARRKVLATLVAVTFMVVRGRQHRSAPVRAQRWRTGHRGPRQGCAGGLREGRVRLDRL
jgi:hypothetical protein